MSAGGKRSLFQCPHAFVISVAAPGRQGCCRIASDAGMQPAMCFWGSVVPVAALGYTLILYVHVVAGTVCFSAVYGLDTCQVVNTFCRMVSLRLGLGCFYRSSSAPPVCPSQAFSVHAADAVSLLSRYQSSASAWPCPVRLPRGLHARAATSTHECKVTLNLLNAQIIA